MPAAMSKAMTTPAIIPPLVATEREIEKVREREIEKGRERVRKREREKEKNYGLKDTGI